MNTAKNNNFFFFLNLEKQRGAQSTIKKLVFGDKETTDQTLILECIKRFCKTLLKKCKQKTPTEIKSFFSHINTPTKLSEDKAKLCEEDLTENDLYDSLKRRENEKSAVNNGLRKTFYETF